MMKNANNGIGYPPLHYWHLLFIFRIDSLNDNLFISGQLRKCGTNFTSPLTAMPEAT